MNKQRRKDIDGAVRRLQTIKASAIEEILAIVERSQEELETARDEEQDYFDNMPESMQGSEKGGAADFAISALSSCLDSLEEARSSLETASNSIEEAISSGDEALSD